MYIYLLKQGFSLSSVLTFRKSVFYMYINLLRQGFLFIFCFNFQKICILPTDFFIWLSG